VDGRARGGTLSGGQRRRLGLAALLIGEWDVLMLDEPTNHLDVEGIAWLARHLKNRWPKNVGGLLVVTHDRWFLDEVANSMWEVHDGVVEPFEGGYAAYVLQRVERDRIAAAAESKRQNLMRKELAWLRRGAPARTSKPRFRIEAANRLIADVPPVRDSVKLTRMAVSRLGKDVVDLEDADVRYGDRDVLREITWRIAPGERTAILGANGAGKSTLYNVIAGTLSPTAGTISLSMNGSIRDITKDEEYKRALYIGRIFQNPLLGTAGKMSLEDNMMICSKKGWKGLKIGLNARTRSYFRSELKQLNMGLEERLSDNVEQFSGGQRQALTLLMAVMSRPALLLLDEHTAALDPSNAALVMNLTKRFAESYNLTVMMVTHNMQHALDYGNRLIMMDKGEIIFDIAGDEKKNLTMDDIVQRFRSIKKTALTSDRMILQ